MDKQLKKTLLIVVPYFLLYLICTISQSNFWGDLISPIGTLLSAFIIFNAVSKSSGTKFHKIWALFVLAELSYATADILWAIYDLCLNKNPENSLLIGALYLGTTAFIIIGITLYLIYKFRKWDTVQLVLDAVAMSICVIWLLWVLVFDKQYVNIGLLAKYSVVNTISIIVDMIQMIGIMIWYLSIRGGKIPLYLRVIAGSLYCYTIVDLFYYYLYMKGLYVPNSIIDSCYMSTLLGLAVGVKMAFITNESGSDMQNDLYSNIGYRHKGMLLLPAPFMILIFKGPDYSDILFFVLIILLYEIFSNYIQSAVKNKKLLELVMNLNSELEHRVSERTKDLALKNIELEYISTHDSLTGLHNRRYFFQKLEEKIKRLAPNEKLAMLFWNVDRLKTINETNGHSTGDEILTVLSEKMKKLCGQKGELARFGGDEFAFAINGDFQYHEIEDIAKRIVDICNEPIQIGQYTFEITISVGISIIPLDAHDSGTLLMNADVAMQYAKKQGFSKYISFYDKVNETMQRKHLIEAYLKKGEYNKEFTLFFQPQFRMVDKKLIGMEALIRWNCPELGAVSPSEFIPIAEETDLIIPISNWVIEKAISQISEWNHSLNTNLRMGINISPKQLNQSDFLEIFSSIIQLHHASVGWIDIEITEGVTLSENVKSVQIKNFFQSRGGTISIDDFGTGYSTLGYLKILSFDRIKIPKQLIDNIVKDEVDRKIVSSIIMLAKSLGIKTISEGVEKQEQFDLLLELGCDQIQGYYLGKPMTPQNFRELFLAKDIKSYLG